MSSFIKFFSTNSKGNVYDHTRLELIEKELDAIYKRQSNLRIESTDHELLALLEEVIPLLEAFNNYDPTPQYLYDDTGGEPPMSSHERWHAGFIEHQRLHS